MAANYTDALLHAVTSVLGAPPDPAPLLPEVLSVVAQEGFRREHLKYQVSPNDWSYAYLLIPNNLRAPAPVVVCHHTYNGDFTLGKAEVVGLGGDKNNALGVELAQRGYVVFAPDALGFGERRAANSRDHVNDLTYSFNQLALRLLRGETLLRKVLWDISRGIDYLETRAEIDCRRLGFVGTEYGAKMAFWVMATEPRVRAAVAHANIITYREQIKRGAWLQFEFVVPRLMQVADMHHILTLAAPRPFLLSTAPDSQHADVTDLHQRVQPVYDKLGVANRLSLYSYPNSSVMNRQMRYNAYVWLDSWLRPA